MVKIAPSYSEQQVLLCSIDVIKNLDMIGYLEGGRAPRIRVYYKGKVTKSTFTGDQSEEFVRNFIDAAITNSNE